MADLFPVAGAKIYIGPALAPLSRPMVESDFSSTEGDWTEIDGWETCGGYGDAAEVITTQLINRGRDVKQKGTRNAGQMTNQFAEIIGDAGQAALIAAEASPNNFSFRVVYDDVPEGGTTGSTDYFVALVTSWSRAGGGANTIRMREANLEVNSNVVQVAAA